MVVKQDHGMIFVILIYNLLKYTYSSFFNFISMINYKVFTSIYLTTYNLFAYASLPLLTTEVMLGKPLIIAIQFLYKHAGGRLSELIAHFLN